MNPKTQKTPMDAALSYLAPRARTEMELKKHLDEKNFGEFEVDQVVERLKELGYINDAQFAQDFVRTRLATKAVSKRHLRQQLTGHFVPREQIDAALAQVSEDNEFENAVTVASKYAGQTRGLSEEKRRERVLRRLCARGYDYDTAKIAFEQALMGEQNELD